MLCMRTDMSLSISHQQNWVCALACACNHIGSWTSRGVYLKGLMSTDTQMNSIPCQHHWSVCNGALLRAVCLCGRLWWTMRHAASVSNSQENLEGMQCRHPTSPQPVKVKSQASNSRVILIVSLTSRDPCTWTSKHVMTQSCKLLLPVFRSCIPKSRIHIMGNSVDSIMLLHDNVHHHVTHRIQD